MSRAEGFAPIPTWMIRDTEVSIYALTVYAALSSRSGLREIIPGQATLAREARCSERQVRRALAELEALGVVTRVRRKNSTGRAPDGYTLHPNGRTEVTDTQSATSEVPDSDDRGTGLGEQGFRPESASTPSIRQKELGREIEASLSPDESDDHGTLIPDVWRPNQSHIDKAASLHLDVKYEYQRFRRHAETNHRRLKNWNAGFTNWLRKSAEMIQQRQGQRPVTNKPAPMDRMRAGLDAGARVQAAIERGELIA